MSEQSNRKLALITGGTDGIGKATAQRLLVDGWQVVITGRSEAKADATVSELRRAAKSEHVSALVGDLSLMRDVLRLAESFLASHQRLDLLMLNANTITQERVLTAEGFESNLAIGYLGRVLLLWMLEETLRATHGAQILTVVGLNLSRLNLEDPNNGQGKFSSMRALGEWQWCMQVFAREFNQSSAVPLNVFMPGLVKTKILANEPQPMRAVVKLASLLFGISLETSSAEVAQVIEDVTRHQRRDGYYARAKLKPPRELKMKPNDTQRLLALTRQLLRPYLLRP